MEDFICINVSFPWNLPSMFIWAKNHALLRVIYNISNSLWRLRVLAETSVIDPEASGGERGRERRKSLVWEKKKGGQREERDR